jgi:hypothetical protein
MIWAPEAFGRCSKWFEQVLKSLVLGQSLGRSNRPQAVRSQRGGLTALGRRYNHPGQAFALCCITALA